MKQYLEWPATHREHAGEIQRHLGYRDFTDQPGHFQLVRWLYTRAWLSVERSAVLFDLTTAWQIERKILLPSVTALTPLIVRVRDRASPRLWRFLARLLSAARGVESRVAKRRGRFRRWAALCGTGAHTQYRTQQHIFPR